MTITPHPAVNSPCAHRAPHPAFHTPRMAGAFFIEMGFVSPGHLHVQVELLSREAQAFISREPVPEDQWCQIQLALEISLVGIYSI